MNEWFKKKSFNNILIILVATLLLLWGGFGHIKSFYYSSKYRNAESELKQSREQLESASESKYKLEECSRRTCEITERAEHLISESGEILEVTGNTIAEIRKQVNDLQEYCYSLECYISDISNVYNNTNINNER